MSASRMEIEAFDPDPTATRMYLMMGDPASLVSAELFDFDTGRTLGEVPVVSIEIDIIAEGTRIKAVIDCGIKFNVHYWPGT